MFKAPSSAEVENVVSDKRCESNISVSWKYRVNKALRHPCWIQILKKVEKSPLCTCWIVWILSHSNFIAGKAWSKNIRRVKLPWTWKSFRDPGMGEPESSHKKQFIFSHFIDYTYISVSLKCIYTWNFGFLLCFASVYGMGVACSSTSRWFSWRLTRRDKLLRFLAFFLLLLLLCSCCCSLFLLWCALFFYIIFSLLLFNFFY